MTILLCAACAGIAAWIGSQLLRQNGRLLLRVEDLEQRLNELEFGDDESQGLPPGNEPPTFELPDLSGERKSLAQFRGQPVLLVFFNPDCGFCREMMPKLTAVAAGFQPAVEGGILPPGNRIAPTEALETLNDPPTFQPNSTGLEARLNGRQGCPPPQLLILTTGDAAKNRQFFAEHKVDCPVLLQDNGEIAKAYQAQGTPSGYLISSDGKIASALAMGADALLALADGNSGTLNPKSDQSLLSPALSSNGGEGDKVRADRFNNRSLTRSKIERDGLNAGTPAPDFRLPRLDGKGELTLSELRGKPVLLVFSSPGCGPCNELAPELEKFHRQQEVGRVTPCAPQRDSKFQNGAQGTDAPYPTTVVMISKGEPKENRLKVKEHGLTFPIVLQQQWEISRRYAMFATPVAYLIDERGIISNDVAVGTEQIQALLSGATNGAIQDSVNSFVLNSAGDT